jgi:microcystin degradation protein MlrC
MTSRVAVLGVWHETNTYAATPTTLDDFAAFELVDGDALVAGNRGVGSVIGGFLDADDVFELVPCFTASAWPGGTVSAAAFDTILRRALASLEDAAPFDGLLLNLHGAMVSERDDDPERTLVAAIRERFPAIPISAVVDLHANVSPALVSLCDSLISYDTYPHVDMRERGREAAARLDRMLAGTPMQTIVAKIPILASPLAQATADEPMLGLQARARARGERAGVRVCIVGGYCHSDVERAGVSVLVAHDAARAVAANEVLRETAADVDAQSERFLITREPPAASVARALGVPESGRPVVLADIGDNVGGGSAGDGTALLRELLAQGARRAVVIIADPESALAASELGEGAVFEGAVGGKVDDRHGAPVEIRGTVVRTSDGRYTTAGTWMTGREFTLGLTAVVDVDGTHVVLTERRVPPFHAEQLSSLGLDPATFDIIVAKGAHAWRAAFADVARTILESDTPGITPVDPASLPRLTTPMRT